MRQLSLLCLALSLACTASSKSGGPLDAPEGFATPSADGSGPYQGELALCDDDFGAELSARVPLHFWSFDTEGCGEAAFDVSGVGLTDAFVLLYRWNGVRWNLIDYNDDCGTDTFDSCIEQTLPAGQYLVGASTYDFIRLREPTAGGYVLTAVCRDEGHCGSEEQACGSRGLEPCAAGEYCDFEPAALCGRADAPGVCRPRPEACPAVEAPVCGCDGQTYSNACVAAAFGVSADYEGACEPDGVGEACGGLAGLSCAPGLRCDYSAHEGCGLDYEGVCVVDEAHACSREYWPMCGCDGVTYSNDCARIAAGVVLDHEGACEVQPEPAGDGELCGGESGIACEEGLRCDLSRNLACGENLEGVCSVDDIVFCPAVFDPQCGCNGVTYSNGCERAASGVALDHEGACGDEGAREGEFCGGIAGIACGPGLLCDLSANETCGADLGGECRSNEPRICPAIADPVCGCDGRTYGNSCELVNAGMALAYRGLCEVR
ncbi:MAG: Kazal-type serine protease inhibitor domain-containing protein [Myxococcota bacterium]